MAKCAECGGVILPENQQKCDCIVPTPHDTKATYADAQIREAIEHGKERYKDTRRYGMVCAEIMEQQQREIERLREALDEIETLAANDTCGCNKMAPIIAICQMENKA